MGISTTPAHVSDFDMFTVEAVSDPQTYDGRLREQAPAVYLERYDIWVTGRHEHVHAAARDWETFSSTSRPFHDPNSIRPEILLTDDPPEHPRVRAVIQRALSPAAMKRMRGDFEREAEAHVDRLLAGATTAVELDGRHDIASPFVLKVFPDSIGLPEEGREHLIRFGDAAFNTFGPPNEIFREGLRKGAEALEWVEVNCKPEVMRPGGMGATIYAAAESGEVTWDEAELLVKTLFSAGSDTTIFGIGNLLQAFARFPEQWQALRADPSRSRAAFEEMLRYDCPARYGGRITTRPVDLDGVELPQGARLLLLWMAAGRDPRRWQDPERYDLGRKVTGHIGLGFGIHACVGQALARMEGETLFAALARRVERIELAGEPEAAVNMAAHGHEHLPLRLHLAA
jgi:4-methoxybenzoate monooxygenase (O-demethylating)